MKLARRTFTIAGIAVALGAAATSVLSQRRVSASETAYPPIGQFVDVDGTKIHYLRTGSGPEIILLHGAGGNLRDFTFGVIEALSKRYTVTAFDRPGLGYSDRHPDVDQSAFGTEGESPMQQADLLRSATEKLGIKNPIVVGHSLGGIVAMAWANIGLDTDSDINATAVVSLAGVSMPWPGPLGQYYIVNGSAFGGAITIPIIAALASGAKIDATIDSIFAPQPAPSDYAERIGASLTLRPHQFRANVRQVNTMRPHVVEMSKRYPELTIPIEILHGNQDTTVPIHVHPYELTKIVSSARLTELSGIGHMPHHVDLDATIATIDRAASRAGLR